MRNKMIGVLAVTTAAVLATAGCAGKQHGTAVPALMLTGPATTVAAGTTTDSSAETTTTTQAPPTNERGAIPKKLGEQAGWTDDDGGSVSFSIDKITVDPRCDDYGDKPKGHTLILDIRITTGARGEALDSLSGTVNPYAFQVIGSDGVSKPVDIGMCKLESLKALPMDYGPNQKYRGQMELDVPAKSGILALALPMQDISGWEWHY